MESRSVLDNIIDRMNCGEHISPVNPDEKRCFDVLRDLVHISGDTDGTISNKKRLRAQLWSAMSYLGAPSWFLTFSPADNHHLIALYYARSEKQFAVWPLNSDEVYRRCASNPVAAARFFHFVLTAFIHHVLQTDTPNPGLYGNVRAYFGTVEQQGRLTLHIHMLLWIAGSLSPQEIKSRLLSPDSSFQQSLFDYLHQCHSGDYINATHAEVSENVNTHQGLPGYVKPTDLLPVAPCQESPPRTELSAHDARRQALSGDARGTRWLRGDTLKTSEALCAVR